MYSFRIDGNLGQLTEGRGAVVGLGASKPGQPDVGDLEGGGTGSGRFISGYRPGLIAELAESSEDRRRRVTADDDASSLTGRDVARAA